MQSLNHTSTVQRTCGMAVSKLASAAALAATILATTAGHAQSVSDAMRRAPERGRAAVTQQADTPATGPLIYIADENGNLATVDTATRAVHVIGNNGLFLTDLAFSPKGNVLYAISFSAIYRINTKTAAATYIASTQGTQLNALYIGANGVAYTEGPDVSELYTLDLNTGAEKPVGSSNGFASSGDITYYNGKLVMTTTSNQLVTLNPSTGAASAPVALPVSNLYGLAATGTGKLYGFAGSSFYQLSPTAKNVAGRAKLLADMSSHGIGTITGAAYDGYFGQ